MPNDIQSTDTRVLRAMADTLKADAKLLFQLDREGQEWRTLFQLFIKIVTEIHRRNNPAIRHQFN